MKRHELTDKQWNRIKDYLPPEKKPHGGRPGKSNRLIFNAILYWLNTGIPWRDLPERFGPWQTVYSRFRTWTLAGVWDEVLSALIAEDLVDETTLMLDSKQLKYISTPAALKKGRRNRAQPRRTDYKSPCGDGWAWESIAFFAFRRKSP